MVSILTVKKICCHLFNVVQLLNPNQSKWRPVVIIPTTKSVLCLRYLHLGGSERGATLANAMLCSYILVK